MDLRGEDPSEGIQGTAIHLRDCRAAVPRRRTRGRPSTSVTSGQSGGKTPRRPAHSLPDGATGLGGAAPREERSWSASTQRSTASSAGFDFRRRASRRPPRCTIPARCCSCGPSGCAAIEPRGRQGAPAGPRRAPLISYRYWQHELGRSDFVYGQFGENFTLEGLNDDEVEVVTAGPCRLRRTGRFGLRRHLGRRGSPGRSASRPHIRRGALGAGARA
jgi:hypothetical protein